MNLLEKLGLKKGSKSAYSKFDKHHGRFHPVDLSRFSGKTRDLAGYVNLVLNETSYAIGAVSEYKRMGSDGKKDPEGNEQIYMRIEKLRKGPEGILNSDYAGVIYMAWDKKGHKSFGVYTPDNGFERLEKDILKYTPK